jgi:hypothetical protein
MKPTIINDRTKWTKGYLSYDFRNRIIVCNILKTDERVGFCPMDMPEVMVKRWAVKVGEFKRVDIVNQKEFVQEWNRRMVDDDNDKYRGFKSEYRIPGARTALQEHSGQVQ